MRPVLSILLTFGLLSGCGLAPIAPLGAAQAGPMGALKRQAADRDPVKAVKAANAPLALRDAALIAQKYALLADNDFSFFRGTAYLFAVDAAADPALATALRIPLQGDLHLENLGTYRTAGGAVAYDLNDFDEAATGPYTWELARMAVSIRLAARGMRLKGKDELVAHFLAAYQRELKGLSATRLAQPLTGAGLGPDALAAIAEAQQATRPAFLADMGAQGRFKTSKKLRPVAPALAAQVDAAVTAYAQGRPEGTGFFRVKDVASRIAGTASLGRYRYVAWIEGPTSGPHDDVILEIKEQTAPTLQPQLTGDPARRVMDAQRHFLPGADPLLGTTRIAGASFLVRELSPAKADVALDTLDTPARFAAHLDSVALVAARAHARSGRAAAILGELGAKAAAIAQFAERYADQVETDRETFKASLAR